MLTPLGNVRLVTLVALQEVILAEVRENVGSLLRHEDARIFGVGEIDFGNLLRKMLPARVEFAHEPLIHSHARLARLGWVAGIDAGDDGKRIVMPSHCRRGHGEQNAIGIDEADLLAHARKGHRLALHQRDANLVGKHAHHRGALDPWNLFKLLAALAEGNKENVAPDVFAEDREHIGAAHFSEARGLNVGSAGDAEARVAFDEAAHGDA